MTQLTIQQTFDLALQHHQAGRLQEAERLYRQILTQQPEHAVAMHHLGLIAYQAGRNDAAVDLIRRAIALDPNSPGGPQQSWQRPESKGTTG
jgi:protein O-GlcNAc transferase